MFLNDFMLLRALLIMLDMCASLAPPWELDDNDTSHTGQDTTRHTQHTKPGGCNGDNLEQRPPSPPPPPPVRNSLYTFAHNTETGISHLLRQHRQQRFDIPADIPHSFTCNNNKKTLAWVFIFGCARADGPKNKSQSSVCKRLSVELPKLC